MMEQASFYLPTGNEWVSIPTLHSLDGRIESINFLSMRQRGLIEITGKAARPLMLPTLSINGQPFEGALTWEREVYWLPRFKAEQAGLHWQGEICVPVGERGFYYRVEVTNTSNQRVAVEFGLQGDWVQTLHTINESKPVRARPTVYQSNWSHSLMFELVGEVPLFAFAPVADQPLDRVEWELDPATSVATYRLLKSWELAPGEKASLCFFWGVGLEEVAAATAAQHMIRQGQAAVKKTTLEWLNARRLTTGEIELDRVMNLNLFFNFFFATGRTLDTEQDVLVTSRSPRYYVSAAYWDRDSLLWSLPSILLADAKRARSMLDYVFQVQSRNSGIHSRYIDGVVLEPGFELDELCAPVIALGHYLAHTQDWQYARQEYVKTHLRQFLAELESHRHPSYPLYDTFLQPTDDPVVYPYLTYDNVLVWKALQIYGQIMASSGDLSQSEDLTQRSEAVRQAIYEQMVVEHEGQLVFGWSVDLEGKYNLYDEPPGSLQLLPFYGFCPATDPIYRNTLKVIRSSANSYAFSGCAFEELGCAHANHPWVLSIANSFLSGRAEAARNLVLRTPLDGGIACESIDQHTGLPRTGEHFATCAGFLAYAIYSAYGV